MHGEAGEIASQAVRLHAVDFIRHITSATSGFPVGGDGVVVENDRGVRTESEADAAERKGGEAQGTEPFPFDAISGDGRQQGGLDAVDEGLVLVLGEKLGAFGIVTEQQFDRLFTGGGPGDGLEGIVEPVGHEVGCGVCCEFGDLVCVEGVDASGDAFAIGGVPIAVAQEVPGTGLTTEADLRVGLAGDVDEVEALAIDLGEEVVTQVVGLHPKAIDLPGCDGEGWIAIGGGGAGRGLLRLRGFPESDLIALFTGLGLDDDLDLFGGAGGRFAFFGRACRRESGILRLGDFDVEKGGEKFGDALFAAAGLQRFLEHP